MSLTEEQMQTAWDKYERGDGLSRGEIRAMLEQVGPVLSYLRQRSSKFGTLVRTETVLTAERLMGFDLELQKREENLPQEDGVLRVLVDLSEIEEADNTRNETTYYGGQWRVGEKVGPGHGDDRSDNHLGDVEDEVLRLIKDRWPDVDLERENEEGDDAREVVSQAIQHSDSPCILVVKRDGGLLKVDSESAP